MPQKVTKRARYYSLAQLDLCVHLEQQSVKGNRKLNLEVQPVDGLFVLLFVVVECGRPGVESPPHPGCMALERNVVKLQRALVQQLLQPFGSGLHHLLASNLALPWNSAIGMYIYVLR